MPGYFISNVGDMMRTYLSPANEEESDFSKIEIREKYFKSLWEGYMGQMKDELAEEEKRHFIWAGQIHDLHAGHSFPHGLLEQRFVLWCKIRTTKLCNSRQSNHIAAEAD